MFYTDLCDGGRVLAEQFATQQQTVKKSVDIVPLCVLKFCILKVNNIINQDKLKVALSRKLATIKRAVAHSCWHIY